jgi:hypothetical protein
MEITKFSFAIEKLSGLWQIGRSDMGIQQRGSGHASYARALIVAELALARTRANRAQISVCLGARAVTPIVKECDVIP